MKKMEMNLVAFPRYHFLSLCQAPLFLESDNDILYLTERQLWMKENFLSDLKSDQYGKYWGTNIIYRGDINKLITVKQVTDGFVHQIFRKTRDSDTIIPRSVANLCEEYHGDWKEKEDSDLVYWIPDQIKEGFVNEPLNGTEISGTLIANTTAVSGVFRKISDQFSDLYHRKDMFHLYTENELQQLQEAHTNLMDFMVEMQENNRRPAYFDSDSEDEYESE